MRGGSRAKHRQSVAHGKNFEEWVEMQHASAKRRGMLVHVVHNQAQSKVVGWRMIYTGAGVADYTGCMRDGKCLATEAKSTGKDRLAKSEITPKQQEHLTAVSNACGYAYLLVEFRGTNTLLNRRYAIPWSRVPWKVLRTAESLVEADIKPCWRLSNVGDYLPGGDRAPGL